MTSSNLADDLLCQLGGVSKHELNSLLHICDSSDGTDDRPMFSPSDYYDVNSFIELCRNQTQAFASMSLNVDSIHAKFDALLSFMKILNEHDFFLDAIFIQETRLSDEQCSKDQIKIFDMPGYLTIPLGKKTGSKGGLIIYLRDIYRYTNRNLYKPNKHWEGIFVDVTHMNNEKLPNKITLGNIYRAPRGNYSDKSIMNFLTPYKEIHQKLTQEHSTLILGGDFNLDLINLKTRKKFQEYFDLFVSNGALPQVTLPTRFSKNRATLIDQIYCRFTKYSSHKASGIIATKISDHLPCFSVINFTTNIHTPKPKYIKIQKTGPEAMQNYYQEVQKGLESEQFIKDLFANPKTNYEKIENIVKQAKINCFPVKEVKFNKRKHKIAPWINFGILNAINARDKLYVQWKQTSLSSPNYDKHEEKFRKCCSTLQKHIRKAKSDYYQKQFQNYLSDIKKTWSKINEILCNKKQRSDFPEYFIDKNKLITKDEDIANYFNNFFCNIGPELANSIKGPPGKSYKNYLTQTITSTFTFKTIDSDFILKLIRKLKPKSSFGHDGISSILLKHIADIIAPILAITINQSLMTGIFPKSLKIAKISPIYKKENPHIADNYRPISLLPVISKIFEKVVFIQVYDYFVENKLLYDSQYGFRKRHSTELAALEFIDKIATHLDQGKLPLAIFLDLSKAFDTIDHSILINKLEYYGIKGNALNWFKSYLQNRKQFVQYKDSISDYSTIQTGVPQGSILGPLLFIIYMNDIARVTKSFHFTLYADDTTLLEPLCSFTLNQNLESGVLSEAINKELKLITDWLCLNKLSLNAKKTKMMIFHHRQKNIARIKLKLLINNTPIECVSEFNFLGVVIDKHITWNSHIQKISGKIACIAGTLTRLKRFLPKAILKIIYNALIQPHLNFGVLLWGSNTKRIYKLQKWALRAITCSKYNAHCMPLFKELKLLRIQDIYKLNMLKFYYKYKKSILPNYFRDMFKENFLEHEHDTRHKNEPVPSSWGSNASKNTIRHTIPSIIKNSEHIDKIDKLSLQSFSKSVKNSLIEEYDPICRIKNCYICQKENT